MPDARLWLEGAERLGAIAIVAGGSEDGRRRMHGDEAAGRRDEGEGEAGHYVLKR